MPPHVKKIIKTMDHPFYKFEELPERSKNKAIKKQIEKNSVAWEYPIIKLARSVGIDIIYFYTELGICNCSFFLPPEDVAELIIQSNTCSEIYQCAINFFELIGTFSLTNEIEDLLYNEISTAFGQLLKAQYEKITDTDYIKDQLKDYWFTYNGRILN